MGNPLTWLVWTIFTLLVCVLLLRWIFALLAPILPWLIVIAVLIIGVVIWRRVLSARQRKW